MKSLLIRSGLAVLLCCALLCACGLPLCCAAAEQSVEEVILFTQMDEETGLYLRMDEPICGVSETLSAAFIPKNDAQTVPQIDSGKIRILLPCAENGERLELFLPVSWTPNNAVLRISGLLDGTGATVERDITFARGNYAIDRVRIDYPDPDKTETIRSYTGAADTIYCLQGDTIRFGMDSDMLLRRTQALAGSHALRVDEDENCAVTAVAAGESALTLRIAQKMEYTVKVHVFASAQERKQFLLRSAVADTGTILNRYFHKVVSQAIILDSFSFLAAPILYPLAVIVAPIGYVAELIRLTLND